jgi:hypothetical protein
MWYKAPFHQVVLFPMDGPSCDTAVALRGGATDDAMVAEEGLETIVERLRRVNCSDGGIGGVDILRNLFSVYKADTVDGLKHHVDKDIDRCCNLAAQLRSSDDHDALMSQQPSLVMAMSALYYITHAVSSCSLVTDVLARGPVHAPAPSIVKRGKGKKKGGGGDGGDGDKGGDQIGQMKSALAVGMARFNEVDPSEMNDINQLHLYLLNCAFKRGYRRLGMMLYLPVIVDGHRTHAWREDCSIKEFISASTCKELNFDMWRKVNTFRNKSCCIDYLAECQDTELPVLKKDRTVFAFRNGIYFAGEDKFVDYGSEKHAVVSEDVIAAKYFDLEIEASIVGHHPDAPESMATPVLQSIMDFQKMSPETCFWLYAMIGRLIYNVGDRDSWQVIPFLKGAASTGKSTIINYVCCELFEKSDVGVMSNNIEGKFGLWPLVDKLLFAGPEIKQDFRLEQAEFQSIVSGEAVQVAVKHSEARTVHHWTTPGIMAGNQLPGYTDHSNSISRRILIFDFPRMVSNGDMFLKDKLKAEMGSIIVKANRCYRKAVRMHGKTSIWEAVPQAMKDSRTTMKENVNSIVSFLNSNILVFSEDAYMPVVDFISRYTVYVEEMGMPKIRPNSENLMAPLAEKACYCETNATCKARPYPRTGPGATLRRNMRFVVGCDIRVDDDGDDADAEARA